jgi:hypothetical protein
MFDGNVTGRRQIRTAEFVSLALGWGMRVQARNEQAR